MHSAECKPVKAVVTAVLLVLLGYLAELMITPKPLGWELETAVVRLMIQL